MDQKRAFAETLDCVEHRWPPIYGAEGLTLEHMQDMMRRIDENRDVTAPDGFSEAKLGRWLGYLQGVAVAIGAMTLDEAKEINKACAAAPDNAALKAPADFQSRVSPWLMACFGPEIAGDRPERNHRFLEEALELVQACGCTRSEARQLVDYVFDRPVGEKHQEVGGVMITLASLCLAQGLDMQQSGEDELARIWTKVEAIRAKQAAKPKHSPLPQHVVAKSDISAPLSQAAQDVLAERRRQVEVEGFADDDCYGSGELGAAAACYAIPQKFTRPEWASDLVRRIWPWSPHWWKPTTRRRDLEKAGALIIAEIERLDRAAEPDGEG